MHPPDRLRHALPRTLVAALVLAWATPAHTQAPATRPASRPFLWRVESDGAAKRPDAWLLGTIHMGDPRVTTLPQVVLDAIAASDVVVTEVAFAGSAPSNMMRRRILPERKRLVDVLPAPLYAELSSYLRAKGQPAVAPSRLKIWAVMLTVLGLNSGGVRPGPTLDNWIVRLGRDQEKEIGELESMEEQIAVFDALTHDEQVALLRSALVGMQRMEAQGRSAAEELMWAWLSGDETAMDRILTESSPELDVEPELRERYLWLLITERNQRLADRMHAMIRANPDRVLFFAVGTFHLFGEEGILRKLREKGCEVTRVSGGDEAFAESRPASASRPRGR